MTTDNASDLPDDAAAQAEEDQHDQTLTEERVGMDDADIEDSIDQQTDPAVAADSRYEERADDPSDD